MLVIRPLVPKKWGELIRLDQEAFGHLGVPLLTRSEIEGSQKGGASFGVLQENLTGEILSYAAFSWVSRTEIKLSRIATAPKHQKKGYASSLILDVIHNRPRGVRRICTYIDERNLPAALFFLNLEFVFERAVPNEYEPGYSFFRYSLGV